MDKWVPKVVALCRDCVFTVNPGRTLQEFPICDHDQNCSECGRFRKVCLLAYNRIPYTSAVITQR